MQAKTDATTNVRQYPYIAASLNAQNHLCAIPSLFYPHSLTRFPPPLQQTGEVDTSKRAAMRATAEAEQATTLHETAKAEVRLTGERADEAVAAVARATREAATSLEETRRMYEERVEASHADRDARVKAAEERARAADHERQRAEAARQAASKELARLQVWKQALSSLIATIRMERMCLQIHAVPSSPSTSTLKPWCVVAADVVVVARCRWRRGSLRVKSGSPPRPRSSSTSSLPSSAKESKLSKRYNKTPVCTVYGAVRESI